MNILVAHIIFGDGKYHPIVSSYLDFSKNYILVDAPKFYKKLKRIICLVKNVYAVRKKAHWYHCHDPISFIISLIVVGRNKTIFDAHEIYFCYVKRRYLRKIFFFFEKLLLFVAVKKIFPTTYRAKVFFKNYNIHENIYIVENLFNDNLIFEEVCKNNFISSVCEEEIHCVYAGTFTEARAIKEIVGAFTILSSENRKYFLHLFGAKTELLIEALRNQSENIFYHGLVSRKELLDRYEKFQLSFALYKPVNLNNLFCAPTKIFENEYYGITTISNKSPYIEELVRDGRINNMIIVEDISSQTIAECLRNYKKESSQFNKNISDKKKLLWSYQIEKIESVYR